MLFRSFTAASVLAAVGGIASAQTGDAPKTIPGPVANQQTPAMPGKIIVGQNPGGAPMTVAPPGGAPMTGVPAVNGCPPGGCGQTNNCNSCGNCAPCITMPIDCCGGCNAGPRSYFAAEYLNYFIKNGPVSAPIATISPRDSQGVLGAPGTQVVLGDGNIDFGNFAGMRLSAGSWLNCERTRGIQVSAFLLESKTITQSFALEEQLTPMNGQNGIISLNTVLARPFFDTVVGQENSRLLTAPDAFTGAIQMTTFTRLWGADVTPVYRVRQNCNSSIDALVGFKFLSLEESLNIDDFSTSLPGGLSSFNGTGYPGPGITTAVSDRFSTANRFYGGSIGGQYNYCRGNWDFGLVGKLGLGTVHQTVAISGSSTLAGPAPLPATVEGGLLAVESNSGRRSRDVFGILPEAEIRVGYRFNDCISVFCGYNFLYLNSVVRPGEQIDRNINHTLVPTDQSFGVPFNGAQPAPQFNRTDFWAHGASFGVALTY